MANEHPNIIPRLQEWIARQPMFFVATAPSEGGRVNVSPKGYDSFAILDERSVAYLDLTGSGAETIAHLRDNGRITIMFCAFTGPPNIVRLQGTGEVVFPDDPRFPGLARRFPDIPGTRSVILVDIERVADSCGFGVPRMELVEQRVQLHRWADRKSADELVAYRNEKNARSIDGLPAVPAG